MRTAIPRASRSPMLRWPRSPSSVTRFTASGTTPSHPTSRHLEAVIPRHTLSSVEPYLGPLGDPLGIRPVLTAQGIEYSLTYIADVLGNPVGGIRQGAIAEDRLNLRLNLDLQKIAGWEGGTI